MGQIVLAGVSSRGLDLYRRVAPYLNEIDYGGFLQISTIYDPEEEVFRFLEFTPRFGTPGSDVMLRLYEGRWTDLSMPGQGENGQGLNRHTRVEPVWFSRSRLPVPESGYARTSDPI